MYNMNIPAYEYHLRDFVVDSAGNSYLLSLLTDSSLTNSNLRTCVLKYNSSGVLQWSDTLSTDIYPGKIKIGSQGMVYVVCTAMNMTDYDFVVRKLDPMGNHIRTSFYGSAQGYSGGQVNCVALDANENIYIAGQSIDQDYSVGLKCDSSGLVLWNAVFSWYPNAYDRGTAIDFDSQGNSYISVMSQDTTGIPDIILLKYSLSGQLMWQQRYGGAHYEEPKQLGIFNDTVIFVGGDYSNGPSDYLLVKFDSSGQLQWDRIFDPQVFYNYPVSASDNVLDMLITSGGDVVLTGRCFVGTGGPRRINVSYDQGGTLNWVARDFYAAEGQSISEDTSGHIVIAGYAVDSLTSEFGIGLSRYDPSGTCVWSTVFFPSPGEYCTYSLCGVDYTGNIYASSDVGIVGADYLITIKYGNTVGIDEQQSDEFHISVFPVPCNTHLTVNSPREISSVTVFDSNGKNVIKQAGLNGFTYELNTEYLTPGLYFYTVELTEDETVTGRFIKE